MRNLSNSYTDQLHQMFIISKKNIGFCILLLLASSEIIPSFAQPITLHKENPHYLEYKGEPLLLVTSAEHYGAVINLDFDYSKYLETMKAQGMNYTRIFTGSYVEVPGSFGIEHNTLSPAPGRFIAPWVRTKEPGLFQNEGKFDLSTWAPTYFNRLHDFMQKAQELEIIVEVTFFCATYQDAYWERHPFNPGNNINQIGKLNRIDFNTLKNDRVLFYQKALITKLTTELNKYDNIFFELSNEPWADNGNDVTFLHKTLIPKENPLGWLLWATSATPATLAWQKELAQTFRKAEEGLPKKHLLAQNYSNFKENLIEVGEEIDILNFHYAWPEAVSENSGWNRPINFDESGFAGSHDTTYLHEAWAFMLSGGAVFNNLDYSFYPGKEDGKGINDAPGGGSENLRKQLKFLNDFLSAFNFVQMKPSNHLIIHSPGLDAFCLANEGVDYAVYLQGRSQGYLNLQLGKGDYIVRFYNPDIGEIIMHRNLNHLGGETEIQIPKLRRLAIGITQK